MLFILSIFILVFTLWAIFYFQLSRNSGAMTLIAVSIVSAFINPWSLILGIPLIVLSIIVMVDALRMKIITQPAYKALSQAMPSMSSNMPKPRASLWPMLRWRDFMVASFQCRSASVGEAGAAGGRAWRAAYCMFRVST